MSSKNRLLTTLVVLSCVMLFVTDPAFSVPEKFNYSEEATETNCLALKEYVEGLTDVAFGKPVTNVTAEWMTSSTGDTFCQVTGWIWPETQFQVTMPTVWNERYQMNGGGGWDGSLRPPSSPNADGYAQSSANGGYMAANWPSPAGSFGLKEPYFSESYDAAAYPTGAGGYYGSVNPIGSGNPFACQKIEDYGYRHLYETPVIAKKIIEQYYGKAPVKSYYLRRIERAAKKVRSVRRSSPSCTTAFSAILWEGW